MNREFLDLYNRELQLLHEHAREFAEEYPGIAERLGGLAGDRMDPMVGGLLEGAAFLAARVQLKMKHEFPEFTNNLFEQLVPNYLAPTPSAMLGQFKPPYSDPALRDGMKVQRSAYLDATYMERERRVSCRFRLTSGVTMWPFDIRAADYHATPGPLQALGVPIGRDAVAGLRITLTHRMAVRPEEEISDKEGLKVANYHFAGCRTKDLPFHILGSEADAIALHEQIFADTLGVWFRYEDQFGDPVVLPAPEGCLQPVGFDEDEALMPSDKRVFRGFDLLRELFWFPRKFMAFKLTNLQDILPKLKAKTVDVIFAFDEVNAKLAAVVERRFLALYAAPAINLFEKTTDRIPVTNNQHEYQIIPDRSRYLDYEPHRIVDVHAHFTGGHDRQRVPPLYGAPDRIAGEKTIFHTVRRLPRRRSVEERRHGASSDYTGTDMFISLVEPAGVEDEPAVAELSVRAICSNRHLPEQLPVGESGADFRLLDNIAIDIACVAGPTAPREPVVGQLRTRTDVASTGVVAWRIINMLSLNHLGLVQRGAGQNGQALKEMLTLFADLSESATERRIRGIRSVDSRPIVRRLRQRTGTGAARGIEITVVFDEKSFEGSGPFLMGAVLDRFFAEYASMNHFTQTVIRTVERGEIMRWPPRVGARRLL